MKKLYFCTMLLAMACGGGGAASGGGGSSSGGENHHAADLSAFEGAVSGDAAAGQQVFANFCEGCHPGGYEGIGEDLHTSHDSPAEARYIVRVGAGRMPAFGPDTISDADLENVIAHLQTYGMFQ